MVRDGHYEFLVEFYSFYIISIVLRNYRRPAKYLASLKTVEPIPHYYLSGPHSYTRGPLADRNVSIQQILI